MVNVCLIVRDLLQLHHVHGGQLCGDDHHGPQLSPQAGGHPRDAGLGEVSVPAVAALATSHVSVTLTQPSIHCEATSTITQAGGENYYQDYPGPEENEGARQERNEI